MPEYSTPVQNMLNAARGLLGNGPSGIPHAEAAVAVTLLAIAVDADLQGEHSAAMGLVLLATNILADELPDLTAEQRAMAESIFPDLADSDLRELR